MRGPDEGVRASGKHRNGAFEAARQMLRPKLRLRSFITLISNNVSGPDRHDMRARQRDFYRG
jgi:hypothetical protein